MRTHEYLGLTNSQTANLDRERSERPEGCVTAVAHQSYSLRHLQLFPLTNTVVLVRVLCGWKSSKILTFKSAFASQTCSCAGFCTEKFPINFEGLLSLALNLIFY